MLNGHTHTHTHQHYNWSPNKRLLFQQIVCLLFVMFNMIFHSHTATAKNNAYQLFDDSVLLPFKLFFMILHGGHIFDCTDASNVFVLCFILHMSPFYYHSYRILVSVFKPQIRQFKQFRYALCECMCVCVYCLCIFLHISGSHKGSRQKNVSWFVQVVHFVQSLDLQLKLSALWQCPHYDVLPYSHVITGCSV